MMPGPEEFRRDIRAAKRFGLAQGLLLLPSLFSLILAIAFAVDGSWRETAMAVGVCVLLAGVLVCLECKENVCAGSRPNTTPSPFLGLSTTRQSAPP